MEKVVYPRLLAAFLFPALGGLLYGYDIGATAMVLFDLESAEYSGTKWYSRVRESPVIQGLITSMVTVGAVIGSLACLKLEMTLGRRAELMVAASLYIIGSLGEYASADIFWLCVARCAYGVGVGFAMHGAPSYIAETAPAHLRGGLVSAKEAMIVVGMLAGYAAGDAYRRVEGGWRSTFLTAAPVGIFMLAGMIALPRSPRWLALRGRRDEAKRAMRFVAPDASDEVFDALFPKVVIDDYLEELDDDVHDGRPPEMCCGFVIPKTSLVADPASRLGLVAGVGLVVLQQVTGQPSVLYYAAQLFDTVGLGSSATIYLASWKLLCTSLAVTSVDAFGRRALLFAGTCVMAVSLAGLACLTLPYVNASAYFVLVCMFLYIGGYQIGFGPVTWTVISEIFPLARRGQALAVATVTNFTLNALVTFVAAPLLAVSAPACFAAFFFLTLYTIRFVHVHVPETRGLALEQITTMLRERAAAAKDTSVSYGALPSAESKYAPSIDLVPSSARH
ncbi:hypothetical protein CTAYLR_003611 [Chrysophaeum taylorii]|uniref:Hexose transporter 1 n=1 Tax=Chrysophaeum taylorii TaxID=2483200 RepID=A0AAD7UCC2_9STRA|nr:hypothetical protein CTAYLR_003611 [Chrysophaeum taylorii]